MKKLIGTCCVVMGVMFCFCANAQTSDYVADHVFTNGIEGPAVDAAGNLYVVNFAEEGTIGIVNKQDHAELFIRLPTGSVGNGIRFSTGGDMYVADYVGHNILKINVSTKAVSVFAHGDLMNQPNDIAITKGGTIFASDPNWKAKTGRLWRVDQTGQIKIIDDDMGTANGVEVSTDEKFLYVNESEQRKIWRYRLNAKTGEVSAKKLFVQFADFGLDGMRCDSKGNLYVARYGAGEVVVISPNGKVLRHISLKGRDPTNVAFGGADGKTLFVTLQDRGAIEFTRVLNPGREWGMLRHP